MSDPSRSPLTAFVSGDLNPYTLYLGLVNIAVKEKGRFGAREIVDVSREKITERPEVTPAELRLVADMCMNIAETMYKGGHDDHAIIGAEEAERLYRRVGDEAAIARSVDQKTLIQARLGGVRSGSPEAPRPASRIDALSQEIYDMLARQEFERAMEPVAEFAELARESGDKKAMITSLDFRSKILAMTGDAAGAAELVAEQKALIEEMGDPQIAAKTDLNNGLNLLASGQFDRARELLDKALRSARERGYATVEGSALWALSAITCEVDKDLNAAQDLAASSVAAFQRAMDGPGMAKSMAMQAQILTQLGRVAEALPLIERALKLATNLQMQGEINSFIGPIMGYVGAEAQRLGIRPGAPAAPSSPGPGGQAARTPSLEQAQNEWAAAQYAYMKEIAEWKALPLLKRLKTPKPQPPKL